MANEEATAVQLRATLTETKTALDQTIASVEASWARVVNLRADFRKQIAFQLTYIDALKPILVEGAEASKYKALVDEASSWSQKLPDMGNDSAWTDPPVTDDDLDDWLTEGVLISGKLTKAISDGNYAEAQRKINSGDHDSKVNECSNKPYFKSCIVLIIHKVPLSLINRYFLSQYR